MQTIRRGGCFVVLDVPFESSAKASSHGSASEMPVARMKERRVICMGLISGRSSGFSLLLEERALHDLVNQRFEAVIFLADIPNDVLDIRFVLLRRGCAGGVSE